MPTTQGGPATSSERLALLREPRYLAHRADPKWVLGCSSDLHSGQAGGAVLGLDRVHWAKRTPDRVTAKDFVHMLNDVATF